MLMRNSKELRIPLLTLCLSLTLLSGCSWNEKYSLPDKAPGEYGNMAGELVEILGRANCVIRNYADGKLYRFELAYGSELSDYEIGEAMYVEYRVEEYDGGIKCDCLILTSLEEQNARNERNGKYSLPDEAPGEYGSMTGELVEILEWANFVIRNYEDGELYRFKLAYGGDLRDYEIGEAMYIVYSIEEHDGETICYCNILRSVEEQNARNEHS